MTIWRQLWPTANAPHLFWGETAGVPWVAHYSPVAHGPGLRYTLVLDGKGGNHLYTFDERPTADEVRVAVESWFRTAAPQQLPARPPAR